MNLNLSWRNTLPLVFLIAAIWAMTNCGSQRICRLRGGTVVYIEPTTDNWRCGDVR